MRSTMREHHTLHRVEGTTRLSTKRPLKASERKKLLDGQERAEHVLRNASGERTPAELFAIANLREFKRLLGEKRPNPSMRRTFKKPAFHMAVPLVRSAVLRVRDTGRKTVCLEEIVEMTRLHPKLVDKAFMVLNREGLLGQAKNTRHEDFEWVASEHPIHSKAYD